MRQARRPQGSQRHAPPSTARGHHRRVFRVPSGCSPSAASSFTGRCCRSTTSPPRCFLSAITSRRAVWPQPDGHEFVYDGQHPHPPGVNCGSPKGAETPFCAALAQSIAKAGWVMSEPHHVSRSHASPWFAVDKCVATVPILCCSAVRLLVTHLMLSFTMIPAEILLAGMDLIQRLRPSFGQRFHRSSSNGCSARPMG